MCACILWMYFLCNSTRTDLFPTKQSPINNSNMLVSGEKQKPCDTKLQQKQLVAVKTACNNKKHIRIDKIPNTYVNFVWSVMHIESEQPIHRPKAEQRNIGKNRNKRKINMNKKWQLIEWVLTMQERPKCSERKIKPVTHSEVTVKGNIPKQKTKCSAECCLHSPKTYKMTKKRLSFILQ